MKAMKAPSTPRTAAQTTTTTTLTPPLAAAKPPTAATATTTTPSSSSPSPSLKPDGRAPRPANAMANAESQAKLRPDIKFILGDLDLDMDAEADVVDCSGHNNNNNNKNEYSKHLSRGNDNQTKANAADDDESRRQDVVELLEQRFGSVSPIFPGPGGSRHGSLSSMGVGVGVGAHVGRASNFRLKFRKSHTCGSLYANCSCSPATPLFAAPPPTTITTTLTPTATTTTPIAIQGGGGGGGSGSRHPPLAALPAAMHLSLSPSNTEASTCSSSGFGSSLRSHFASSSSKLTSGSFSHSHSLSLSTTTTTSAQLSRDDDYDIGDDNNENENDSNEKASECERASENERVHTNEKPSGNERANVQQRHKQSQSQRHGDESAAWTGLVGESPATRTHALQSDSSHARHAPAAREPKSPLAPSRTARISTDCSNATSPSPSSSSSLPRPSQRKAKRLFQSYSHPDTDFVFTDENKNPSRDSVVLTHSAAESQRGRVSRSELRHPKRSSSPNIGQFQVLDVAVHPDLLVKIAPRSPQSQSTSQSSPFASPRSAQQRRRWLQRSNEIESSGSTSDSEHSIDARSPAVEQKPVAKSPLSPSFRPRNAFVDGTQEQNQVQQKEQEEEEKSFNAAQRYFAESGILGPIKASSSLIRKTSKILQDANVIEQIRKTSMILRANSAAALQRKASSTTSTSPTATSPTRPPHAATPITPVTPLTPTSFSSPAPTCTALQLYNENMELPAPIIYTQCPQSPKSPHTIATTCGFSPNLTTQSCGNTDDRDAMIKSLQGEIVSLKDVIKSRDAEIVKLRREIHKLKSVLQQTTNHIPIPHDDLLQSPPAAARCHLPPQCAEITTSSNRERTRGSQTCACCRRRLDQTTMDHNSESNGSLDSVISEYFTCSSSANGSSSNLAGSAVTSTTNNNNTTNSNSSMKATTAHGTTTGSCALAATNGSPPGSVDRALEAATVDAVAASVGDALPCGGEGDGARTKLAPPAAAPVLKKQGVSGESCETSMQQSINEPIPKFDKDFSSKQLIKDAIMDNDFLKNIDSSQVRELVESMYSLSVAKGEFVIREGEVGAHLYVSASGEFEVVKNGKVLGVMGPGKAFGELAILYNCTRTASIRVLSDARVWVLDRRVFQQLMMRTGMQRIENSVNFLRSVPLLKNLSEEVLAKIADVLEVEFYPAGTYIIRQGASGDTFFLISQGTVQVTQKLSPTSEEKEIRTLERGDYFGEQALINEDKRTANIIAMAPGVECLTLDRESFTHLIGDLCELKEKNYGDENRFLAMKYAETKAEVFGANLKQEFPNMKLTDLEVVATLGIGGFGRVELVKAYQENRVDTFALKCLKKRHIVDTKQEEHVFSERTIMLTCNTPFICRLYRTFRDEKYVYMLLEACMGGEIWTMLRDRGSFDENATQFIIGCVLQAFEYLHSRGIIYRDLKPENLMLDERGYVKLVDFGFAKYIGNSSKTWTFCGTPEYVAPEIILNKGHDRAVDYWALGVLIHELLNGTPPFTANDPMKTYNIILKGIDMIDFPKHMTRSAVQLIKKLCRDVPAERLGYQKGGIQDIKKHKWFLGFDWDGLESQLLIPPFVRPIAHPTDTCYFDRFPCDPNEPPDEFSGWDEGF